MDARCTVAVLAPWDLPRDHPPDVASLPNARPSLTMRHSVKINRRRRKRPLHLPPRPYHEGRCSKLLNEVPSEFLPSTFSCLV